MGRPCTSAGRSLPGGAEAARVDATSTASTTSALHVEGVGVISTGERAHRCPIVERIDLARSKPIENKQEAIVNRNRISAVGTNHVVMATVQQSSARDWAP